MNQPNLLKEAYDYGFKLALAEAGLLDKVSMIDLPSMGHKILNLFGTSSGKTRTASQGFKKWQAAQQAGKKVIPDAARFGQRVGGQLAFNV